MNHALEVQLNNIRLFCFFNTMMKPNIHSPVIYRLKIVTVFPSRRILRFVCNHNQKAWMTNCICIHSLSQPTPYDVDFDETITLKTNQKTESYTTTVVHSAARRDAQ